MAGNGGLPSMAIIPMSPMGHFVGSPVSYPLVEILTHQDFRATWRAAAVAADTGAPMCLSFCAPVSHWRKIG